ncbi:hypothetical protein Aoki45_29940 [Algoriphagus sp. oki45]|uniref:hypothetical protein n=1 Tax=Algoriphagus sp. oki45 TaxID=3067294 RepID=UPI0027E709A9|nr:hypothetical protein Aoki45_29940 [Algoriphagus sp. oki45]
MDNEEVLIEGFLSGVKSSQLTYLWSDFGSKPLDGMQANGRTVERSVDRLLNSRKGTEGFSFENCIDWYWVYSIGGVVVYEEYSHTTCGSGSCDTNSQDACLDDGTNGGGGDGGQIAYKIENNVQNPCISNQVEKAIDAQFKNQITNLINNAFGQSEKFNILLEDLDLNDNSLDGITGTSFTDMAVTFTITINSGALASSSQEYIMVTVFHELLHAYMNYLGINMSSNSIDHVNMANSYLTLLSQALMEHFEIGAIDAYHLAWGGLQNTQKWSELSQTQKYHITETNQKYRSGVKGNKCN